MPSMFERYVNVMIMILVPYLAFLWAKRYFKKNEERMQAREAEENIKIIRSPSSWFMIGAVGGSFLVYLDLFATLGSLGIIFPYTEDGYIVNILFIPVIFLCIGFILMYTAWRVEVRETELLYSDILGRKKIYRYDEIEIEPFASGDKIYQNGKYQFKVTIYATNYSSLYEAYEAYHMERRKKERELKKKKA